MKIAVIGTSNSVLKLGYFETYQAIEYPHQVDLFAIGGTIISYASFALEYYAILANYDVIITEFSTNDSHRYKKNIVSLDYLHHYIYDVFATIHASGKKHINLLLGHPNVEKECEVFSIYRDLCNKFSVENIEVHEIITSLVKTKKELWRDEDHYHSNVIREIAFVLKQKRKKITEQNFTQLEEKKQFLPVRKFHIKTFANHANIEQKGTSLYTFPTLMIEKDFTIMVEENHAQFEGFFYQATPFVGNVSMVINSMIYDCDLFKAASGFFYHYQTKGQENLIIDNYECTICNGKITINENNIFTGVTYNLRPFGLVGITFSTTYQERTYPILFFAPIKDFHNELKDYTKIFSVVQSCSHSLAIIDKITDSDFLFVVAECLEEYDFSLSIYARACELSKYENPYFVYKYFVKLWLLGNYQEIEKLLIDIQEKEYTLLNMLIAEYCIEQKQYEKAECILTNELRKNSYNLRALHLTACLYIQKQEYIKAKVFLEKCRAINKESLVYIADILFCFIQLKEKELIQNLLEELEVYIKQCAMLQYITNFTVLEKSMDLLSKEDCGKFYAFVQYLKKCHYNLI